MKTLILLRHGKSDWDAGDFPDHDRPLAKRGLKAARAMGRFLGLAGQAPESAVTSSAVRARATLEEAAGAGGWKCRVRVTRALYEATPMEALQEVRAEPDATDRLILVGHEPTWSELAVLLMGGGSLRMPTASMLRIDFDVDSWKEVAYGGGRLAWMIPPRLFTDGDFEL